MEARCCKRYEGFDELGIDVGQFGEVPEESQLRCGVVHPVAPSTPLPGVDDDP